MPPLAYACVNELELRSANYVRKDGGGFEIVAEVGEKVPFAVWDPDGQKEKGTRYSIHANRMRVTLDEGDMLYLPALW